MSTDSDWEKFARSDPYFGVLTDERYRGRDLAQNAKRAFFETGNAHVASVLRTIGAKLGRAASFTRALDFGCGVGRLLIPFAKVSTEAIGVDISDAMLAEASKNCHERSVTNVSFFKSDDDLSQVSGKFDLVHSFIVFQHIPTARGEKLFEKLVERVQSGGVGILHLTYAKNRKIGRREKIKTALKTKFPLLVNIENLRNGRPFVAPVMQMNPYNVNCLLFILQTHGVTTTHLEFTDHGGELGIVIYFLKP